MTAQILAFPLARRRAFIIRQANSMAIRSEGLAEKYLEQQLRLQSETLLGKGVCPASVAREVASLERAIRSELSNIFQSSEGGVA